MILSELRSCNLLIKGFITDSILLLVFSTLRPLDRETVINSVKKTSRCVCVEEGWPQCGIAAEIAAIIMESEAFDHLDAPMERITGGTLMTTIRGLKEFHRLNLTAFIYFSVSGADVPMPYATPLEKLALPQLEDIVAVVKRVVNRKL